ETPPSARSILMDERRAASTLASAWGVDALEHEAERERFRVTLSSIGDGVVSIDANRRVVFMNPAAEHLTGWSRSDAKNMDLARIFTVLDADTHQPLDLLVAWPVDDRESRIQPGAPVLVSKQGIERPIETSIAPMRDANGRLMGSVLVFRDITEKRR